MGSGLPGQNWPRRWQRGSLCLKPGLDKVASKAATNGRFLYSGSGPLRFYLSQNLLLQG